MKSQNKQQDDSSKYRKRRGNPHGNAPGQKNEKGVDDSLREGVSESPKTKQ